MTPRQRYWLLCVVGDIAVVALWHGHPWWDYLLTGLAIAIVAGGLAGY